MEAGGRSVNPLPAGRGITYAYVNWSRWVAGCPGPYCRSALKMSPGEESFHCPDCGATGDVCWPPNVDDIAQLLVMRPDPVTRNWLPGETLCDLYTENLLHGVIPPGWLEAGTGPLLKIENDRIVHVLPAAATHTAIGR